MTTITYTVEQPRSLRPSSFHVYIPPTLFAPCRHDDHGGQHDRQADHDQHDDHGGQHDRHDDHDQHPGHGDQHPEHGGRTPHTSPTQATLSFFRELPAAVSRLADRLFAAFVPLNYTVVVSR